MSKNDLPNLSFEERGRLASKVRELRDAAKLKQAELAELAGISRQTLSNIERGAVPQIDNLLSIYEVLGVEIQPADFTAQTKQWLGIVGGIMDSLPEERRDHAGRAAVEAVTAELKASANVTRISEDVAPAASEYALAAKRRSKNRGEVTYE